MLRIIYGKFAFPIESIIEMVDKILNLETEKRDLAEQDRIVLLISEIYKIIKEKDAFMIGFWVNIFYFTEK